MPYVAPTPAATRPPREQPRQWRVILFPSAPATKPTTDEGYFSPLVSPRFLEEKDSSPHGYLPLSPPRSPPISPPLTPTSPLTQQEVRKKSGELVRPALKRTKSADRKYVRFDEIQLERVRFFASGEQPDGLKEEERERVDLLDGELGVELDNFTAPTVASLDTPIMIEEVGLDGNRCLRGLVLVRNFVYHKRIAIRYSLDRWRTVREVAACYDSSPSAEWDRFEFRIGVSRGQILTFAVRYEAEGRDPVWANNEGRDYCVRIMPKLLLAKKLPQEALVMWKDEDALPIIGRLSKSKYDLEASLTAAVNAAPARFPAPAPSSHPRLLPVDSKDYLDFVAKYCFFKPEQASSGIYSSSPGSARTMTCIRG
ncbi:uncharacterized protein VTP21DRAFT_10537 [Calcarisporiella thermophila]|uniref:uncharacterized protein n=1 Tax=Calcarisporiella thermophila TaxID=911321 RepID=UPI003743F16F